MPPLYFEAYFVIVWCAYALVVVSALRMVTQTSALLPGVTHGLALGMAAGSTWILILMHRDILYVAREGLDLDWHQWLLLTTWVAPQSLWLGRVRRSPWAVLVVSMIVLLREGRRWSLWLFP